MRTSPVVPTILAAVQGHRACRDSGDGKEPTSLRTRQRVRSVSLTDQKIRPTARARSMLVASFAGRYRGPPGLSVRRHPTLSAESAACQAPSRHRTSPSGSPRPAKEVASPPASPPTAGDTSEAVCSKFREVAAGAFGESMSLEQIVDGLKEIGGLATTAADPSISSLAVQAGEEANARVLISGKPDQTLDGLAEASNEAFPI
jgi:hypothetical protein